MNSTDRRLVRWFLALAALATFGSAATAQETLTNAYDARGRLVAVGHCGSVNNGVSSNYAYDPADNRSSLTVSTTGGPTMVLNPATLPDGIVGSSYNQKVTGGGGSGGYTYALLSGSLPTGLVLNGSTGAISGTPTIANAYSFTIKATDCAGNNGSRAFSVTVKATALTLSPTTLPAGTAGTAYSQTVSATGGSGAYVFSVASGSLPSGLNLNSATGAITGTPSAAGASASTIRATDSASNVGSRAYNLTIGIGLAPPTLPGGTVGAAYNQTIMSSGGSGGYSYSISAGTLPAGLGLGSATGIILGTPTTANNYAFTVRVADTLNNISTRAYNVGISLALNPAALPDATFGSSYSQTVTASGGSGTYSYAAGSGLPPGLTLSSSGLLSGVPTSAGLYNFMLSANDTAGHTGSKLYSITSHLKISPASLPAGAVGTVYNQPISASGGTGSYSYRLLSGTVPPGLVVGVGSVSGNPTTAGTYTFTAGATDSAGNSGSQTYTITTNLGLSPTTLVGGLTGTAYNQQLTASGGSGTYTFSAGTGVPPGLLLSSAGLLSGTPASGGAYNFTVSVSDTTGHIGSRAYSLNIGAGGTCGGVSFSVDNPTTTAPSPLRFTVTATGPASATCTVHYATSDGSGVAGVNYVATAGTLSFPSSPGTQTVQVTAIAPRDNGLNASVFLNLSSPSSGATISTPTGTGLIMGGGGGCKTCLMQQPTSTEVGPNG